MKEKGSRLASGPGLACGHRCDAMRWCRCPGVGRWSLVEVE